jgi:hypothetical protein
LLVNVAILRYERDGRDRALAAVQRYSDTESVLITAASLRSIGEIDAACSLLEREVRRLGKDTGSNILNGLIAAYAGMERIGDAIAVAALILGKHTHAREHIDMLITTFTLQFNDDPPDAVLEYERRCFDIDAAVDAAIHRLVSSHQSSENQRAKTLAEALGAEDFTLRSEAFAALHAIGPSASLVLAGAIPRLSEARQKEVRAMLEDWAWEAESARHRARLAFGNP